MIHCEIKFDNNPLGIYHSGQPLSGSVELRLEKPKKVGDFTLTIVGSAEIEWTEKDTDDKETTFRGKEDLLRSVTALINRNGETVEIPAGRHVYNFCCVLPPQLLTSYEGDFGRIRYTAAAVLERPWKFNRSCKVAFTVLKTLNLNLEAPALRQPYILEHTKSFCCWPCASKPLFVKVETPVTGYVPGQFITVIITLNNKSSIGVNGVETKLVRNVCYISQSPYNKTKSVTKTIASSHLLVTKDRDSRITQQVEIPSIAPTSSCSVLTIEYELLVVVQVDSCCRNPKLKIPITIGTIPLSTVSTATSAASASYGTFEETATPSAPPPPCEEQLPPTYEEAMSVVAVNVNDDPHAIGSHSYIPRYPVYKLGALDKC